MKARIHVFLRGSVFDAQGSTVAATLARVGFPEVRDVRIGRAIDVDLAETDRGRAEEKVRSMCDKLLVNPVIESFTVEFPE